MVSLDGAKQAEPLVAQIDTLQAAVDALNVAANNTTTQIWQYNIDIYIDGTSSNLRLSLTAGNELNNADSVAILFDIRNVLANEINILTNELGAIT